MNKKWVTIGVVSVLVLGGGYWGWQHFTAKPAVATNITAPATMADVSKVITATGTVNFPQSIPLTFQQSGKIVQLNVKPGDSVKAGQVLAKTDDTKLKTAVLQAQANLTSAQSKLQTLQDGFNPQTQAQAQAAVAKAQQSLTAAQQNADPSYLANQVSLANQTVKQASDALAKAEQSGSSSSIQPAQSALNQAINALTAAKNLQNGGASEALTSAKADLTSAQYQVDQEAQGPKPGDLESAQAGIQLAQVQLSSAQTDLNNAAIIAPMDAVVVSAPFLINQQSDAKSIITITPTGANFEVDAAIDQSDISQVKTGQKVDITLDSSPNQHISGTVSLVALQGTIVSNVTTYNVTVSVDQPTSLLRAGMNANVNIIIAQAKNVLTVPSGAIKTRGTETGVLVQEPSGTQPKNAGTGNAGAGNTGSAGTGNSGTANSGTRNAGTGSAGTGNSGTRNSGSANATSNVRFVPVVIGIDDGTNVEIKSGLVVGEEVVTGTRLGSTTAKATSGSLFGGGGGGANPARALGGGAPRGN